MLEHVRRSIRLTERKHATEIYHIIRNDEATQENVSNLVFMGCFVYYLIITKQQKRRDDENG